VLSIVLTAPALSHLQVLSLRRVNGHSAASVAAHAGGAVSDRGAAQALSAVEMWTGTFANLHDLRSLSLQECDGLDAALAGAAAALVTGNALRNLTALRIDSLAMDNSDGSLIPLLAINCPWLRQLHVYDTSGPADLISLTQLPRLRNLSDLRLQLESQAVQSHLDAGGFAALRRLHLSEVSSDVLHAALCSPQLHWLESLTLESVLIHRLSDLAERLHWSHCFANLHSLRTLNLDAIIRVGRLLAAVRASKPPSLRQIGFRHDAANCADAAELARLAALLDRLPSLTLELHLADVADSNQCAALLSEWRKLRRQHRDRVAITQLRPNDTRPGPFDSWKQ
jgi:hypothetical protein